MKKTSQKTFCAFCKLPRTYYGKKHLGWTNVLLSLLASLLAMYLVWQQFNPKFLIVFVLFICFSEVFIQVRWRLSVVCPHCGFDPVLYIRDHSAACQQVVKVLEQKKEGADFLLSTNNPFKNLPHRKKKPEAPPGESGLSKRI